MTEEIFALQVRTPNKVFENVHVELCPTWVRVHKNSETEMWIPREQIEMIEVDRNG